MDLTRHLILPKAVEETAEMKEPSTEEKFRLVTRNLEEVINVERLKRKLEENGSLSVYWGTAPTKAPHFAYFLPLLKIRDFVQAGCHVTILLADVHSYLDDGFDAVSRVELRTEFYEFVIVEMLKALGVEKDSYEIRRGSEFQLGGRYSVDLLKFSTLINVKDAKKAGTEVVKQGENPKLSSLIYPLMQALDQVALDADVQLGGRDQRKIFALAMDHIESMGQSGYKKASYLINPLIPGLNNKGKMSASDDSSKITFLDSNKAIKKKINKAYCIEKISDISTNAPLAMLKLLFFPLHGTITIQRAEKWGGDVTYSDFRDLEQDWIDGKMASPDVKANVARLIIDLVTPVRSALEKNIDLFDRAYSENVVSD